MVNRPVIASGKKVALVPLLEEDVEWLWKEVNDRDTILLMGMHGILSLKTEKEFVERSYDSDRPKLLITTLKGEKVGVIGVNQSDRYHGTAEVGYWIAKEHRGKGYATEALRLFVELLFRELNYRRLYAFTQGDNEASQRVMEKVGFKLEGRMRKHVYRAHLGRYEDFLVYGLLREEFERFSTPQNGPR